MCGIAGIIDPTGAAIDQQLLWRMTAALASRGPDGEAFWTAAGVGLGHRRLRVIDPSDAARQPMPGEDEQIQVVFNGEIYNFADLRAELRADGHRFRSRSDTEVLVHGYEQWGEGLLDRLSGMFAFALWDGRRRRLLAARDRMGKKPFYFAELARPGAPPLFTFASELKALLVLPGFARTIDPRALAAYLIFDYVPAPATIFAQARKLCPGEKLVLELAAPPGTSAPVISRYWDLSFPESHSPWPVEEAARNLVTLLERAVERRLVADVPLGLFLSGGLDSSTVSALATRIAGADRLKSFSLAFSDPSYDESGHARAVAAHLGTEHHQALLEPGQLLAALPEVTDFMDEPFADSSLLPTYLLCRFARQQVTVALGGDGSDELFAGYPTFQADPLGRLFFDHLPGPLRAWASRGGARLADLSDRGPAGSGYLSAGFKARQFLAGGAVPGPVRHQRWLSSFLPEQLPSLLTEDLACSIGDPLAAVAERARSGPAGAGHPADRLLDFYARFYLGDGILTKVDRAAGAVGLEVRAPFLDADVVSFACQLPPGLRQRRLTGKYLLKRAMRGRLPPAIIDRPKHGFAAPVARWLREDLRPALCDELSPARLRRQNLFDPAPVTALLDDHLGGRGDRRKALWNLFTFQRWLGRWGPG